MRRAAKTDDNHTEVVSAFRKGGCVVLSLAAMGKGCPDLLVLFREVLFLIEVKDGSKSPSRQKLTDDQIEFHRNWPVVIIRSLDDVVDFLNPTYEYKSW